MKNTLAQYTHQAQAHTQWQFKLLRKKYGWAGEGKYWALVNIMSQEENCVLFLQDWNKINCIATELDFTPEELLEFLLYLGVTCRLVMQTGNGGHTTESLQQTLASAQKTRAYDRTRKTKRTGQPVAEIKNTGMPGTKSVAMCTVPGAKASQPGNEPQHDDTVKSSFVNLNTPCYTLRAGASAQDSIVSIKEDVQHGKNDAMYNVDIAVSIPENEQIKDIKENKRKYMYKTRLQNANSTHTHLGNVNEQAVNTIANPPPYTPLPAIRGLPPRSRAGPGMQNGLHPYTNTC